jgi:hypothetical protein
MFTPPFDEDLSGLKDNEIEDKVQELTKKYYTAARLGKPELLTQLTYFITIYKSEMTKRAYQKTKGQLDGDIDQLINVD